MITQRDLNEVAMELCEFWFVDNGMSVLKAKDRCFYNFTVAKPIDVNKLREHYIDQGLGSLKSYFLNSGMKPVTLNVLTTEREDSWLIEISVHCI